MVGGYQWIKRLGAAPEELVLAFGLAGIYFTEPRWLIAGTMVHPGVATGGNRVMWLWLVQWYPLLANAPSLQHYYDRHGLTMDLSIVRSSCLVLQQHISNLSWRAWFEYGFYKFPYWDSPLGALGRHGLNMGFNKPILRFSCQESRVAAHWFLVAMVSIWILTSPYWDPPIRSCSNISWHLGGHGLNMDFINFHIEIPHWELLVDMVWIWVLTSQYWDPPSRVQSCSGLIPGGHGLNMDFNKSILRSPHLELPQHPDGHGLDMDSNKSILRSPHLKLWCKASWWTWFPCGF
jgi:hypothetical protein